MSIKDRTIDLLKELKRVRYGYPFKASIDLTYFTAKRDALRDSFDHHTGLGKLIPIGLLTKDMIASIARIGFSKYHKTVQLALLRETYAQAISGQTDDGCFNDILYPETRRKGQFKRSDLAVFYRYYEKDGKKPRPRGFSKTGLFGTFVNIFKDIPVYVFIDNSSEEAANILRTMAPDITVFHNKLGNAKNLLKALEVATTWEDHQIIYFVEDDYVHRPGSAELILEGFNSGIKFDYLTLYDHPDKYTDRYNRHIKDGGEPSKVYFTGSVHWKETGSTTMTFAATAGTIKQDIGVFKKFSKGNIPQDFKIFDYLRKAKDRRILSSIPGYASHCDGEAIAPLFPATIDSQ